MDTLAHLFGPSNGDATLWQLCARAVFLLAFGILCVRIAGRRTFSQLAPLDIVVAVVVGSNISRMMTGKSSFMPAIGATLLLVILHRLLAICSIRSKWLCRLVKGKPVTLILNGQKDGAAMRRNHIGDDDLLEGLRMERTERIEEVRLATLERGGKISVIPFGSEA